MQKIYRWEDKDIIDNLSTTDSVGLLRVRDLHPGPALRMQKADESTMLLIRRCDRFWEVEKLSMTTDEGLERLDEVCANWPYAC